VPVGWEDADPRLIFWNEIGAWSIWKRFTWRANRTACVGPGYIGRVRAPDGTLVVDDFYVRRAAPQTWGTVNDPQNGGLGCFGFHVARRNGQPDPVNYSWDVTGRHEAASRGGYGVSASRVARQPQLVGGGADERVEASFAVDLTDGEAYGAGAPLATVRYDYAFHRRTVVCRVTVTTHPGAGVGSPAFVKEPKLVCHALGSTEAGAPRYRNLDVLTRDRQLLTTYDIWSLPSPGVKTQQLGQDVRARCRFTDPLLPHLPLEVFAEALGPGDARETWEGSQWGLDRWAVMANGREQLEPCEPDEAYCLQGPGRTLTRQWEVARWASAGRNTPPPPEKPQTGVMLHAWEGGSGYPDCRCCYRRFGPAGEAFRVFLCFTLGSPG
jgi:hypothetical protein